MVVVGSVSGLIWTDPAPDVEVGYVECWVAVGACHCFVVGDVMLIIWIDVLEKEKTVRFR